MDRGREIERERERERERNAAGTQCIPIERERNAAGTQCIPIERDRQTEKERERAECRRHTERYGERAKA